MEDWNVTEAIIKVKAYKQYLKDVLYKVADRYTYEDFKSELYEWNGTKFLDWAKENNLDVLYDDETKEIGLRDRTDEDICIMVRCKISMFEQLDKALKKMHNK